MSNQFFGFSPEAFEQFVRALALSIFGPGVTVFGNGPDGGREATFDGEVPYPYPPATQWSGYGVIQAKCKEKSEASDKDQKWALDLLKEELDAFVKSSKRNPKPHYYIFGRVDGGRGGIRSRESLFPAAFARVPVPQSRPSLRFPPPLFEPDLRISRIRLSDGLHGRHARDLLRRT